MSETILQKFLPVDEKLTAKDRGKKKQNQKIHFSKRKLKNANSFSKTKCVSVFQQTFQFSKYLECTSIWLIRLT